MTPQRILKWGCLTAGVLCLAAGYGWIGLWALIALAGLVWLACLAAAGWFGKACLGIVGLAAAGVCAGAWPPLMILGATLALAGWDSASWEDFTVGGLPAETAARVGREHYLRLALALGLGLLAAIAGRLVSFQIPFGVLAGLSAILLLGIDRIWRFVSEKV
jgi:hypothetical protein